MRVAVFHNLPSGGAKRAVFDQCRALAARGDHVEAFVLSTANEEFLPLRPHVAAVHTEPASAFASSRVPSFLRGSVDLARRLLWLRGLRRAQARLAARIDAGGFDVAVVHSCAATQAPMILGALRTPTAYYCHELWREGHEAPLVDAADARRARRGAWRDLWLRPKNLWRQVRLGVEHRNTLAATRVLVNSRFTREAVLRAVGLDASVCYLGVDVARFRPLGLPRAREVLSIGRITWRKGFRFVVRAVAAVPAAVRPRLVLIGDGENDAEAARLRSLAAERGVELDIRVGVSEDALVEAYNRAAAVVYAPHLEPFGYVPIEAMACGTPTVVVAEGGPRESVVDGQTGFVVDRDEGAFAEAIGRVLDDPARARALGESGVATARSTFSLDAATARFVALLERTAGRAPAPATPAPAHAAPTPAAPTPATETPATRG